MSWYRTGTISLTNGSKNVTGTGTLFVSNVKSGFALLAPDFSIYEVDNVSSDTSFTLKENYRGTTLSNGTYGIFQTQGIIKDLTDEVTALINTFGAFRDAYNNGELVGQGLEFKGVLNSPSELPSSPAMSDAYLIGTYIYVYTGTVGGWKNSNIAGIIPRGEWNASVTYSINDTVTYSGSQYRRKITGTTSTDPATDTTNWELFVSKGSTGSAGITPQGVWNSTAAYIVNDTVQYNGSQYRRIVAGTTSTDPATDTTNWELFVSKGLDGLGSVVKVNSVSPDINGNVSITTDNVPEGSSNLWFTASRVRTALLTGLSTATNAVISATDTILSSLGKLQAQVTGLSNSLVAADVVKGFVGSNNTTTPNTQVDMSADVVILRNSSGGVVSRRSTGTITNNISSVGVNGRDSSTAFTNSSFVHFYFVWNGSTLATVSSANTPSAGPTLPSGYTHWCYATSIYLNSSGQLLKVRLFGNKVFYDSPVPVLVNSTTPTEQAVSLSSAIPSIAYSSSINAYGTFTNSSATTSVLKLKYLSGVDFITSVNVSETSPGYGGMTIVADIPNVSGTIYTQWSNVLTSVALTINVLGYTIPNGG